MGNRPQSDITKHKGEGTNGETTKIGHACLVSASRLLLPLSRSGQHRNNAGNPNTDEAVQQNVPRDAGVRFMSDSRRFCDGTAASHGNVNSWIVQRRRTLVSTLHGQKSSNCSEK